MIGSGLIRVLPRIGSVLFGWNRHFVVKRIGRLIGHVRLLPYFDAGSAAMVRAGAVPHMRRCAARYCEWGTERTKALIITVAYLSARYSVQARTAELAGTVASVSVACASA
jgi:hypothetical protein